jgi:hypothetical protein
MLPIGANLFQRELTATMLAYRANQAFRPQEKAGVGLLSGSAARKSTAHLTPRRLANGLSQACFASPVRTPFSRPALVASAAVLSPRANSIEAEPELLRTTK